MKDKILQFVIYLPLWLNNILLKFNQSAFVIYGKKYHEYKKFIHQNKYQYDNSNELVKIVNYAVENVPYYKRKYKKINNIDEFIEQFGFIDKNIIKKDFYSFLSTDFKKSDYVLATTGGTSGNPLKMYMPENRHIVELGTMHTLWENVGFNHHTRAVIRNKRLKDGVDYLINPITKEVIFDGYRLNDQYFMIIYNTIKKLNIQYIHTFPSTAYEFSRFMYQKGLDTSFIKSFLSSSETVYPYQTELIKNKLDIKFYNWYGHSEKVVLGGYCKFSDAYHIEPTYGFFELIDEDGKPIKETGKVGEIVGTTFHNLGMPLIRYKTDDYAEYVGNYCKYCNRHVTLIKNIEGRRNGLKIYDADGSYTTTTATVNYHDDIYQYFAGLQHVQTEKGKLDILVIKGDGFTPEHGERLRRYYKSKFSRGMQINIKYVDQLLRKPNGKFVELISEIKE